MVKIENGRMKYYDKNGTEITAGCKICCSDGSVRKVYLTDTGELGTDATNPDWIKSGRAYECEYGIYPLTNEETEYAGVAELVDAQE